ncbi:DNA recombination protein RmuC [Parashewanella tropica]|uniref:DNA recombination protein RmuC n=1 Tax=Parashewanella tropica TaxID=2547970 RepID=UPI00105A7C17|nr:DNA recombination protein RmuC [Parashewanella tropica]
MLSNTPLESLTTGTIFLLSAVAILAFLFGMLINQRLTRKRWEHVMEVRQELHETEQATLKGQLQQVQEDYQINIQALGKAQAKLEQLAVTEEDLKATQHKMMEAQLALSKSNSMQKTLMATHQVEKKAFEDKIALLESAEARLKTEFENLASKIFDDRNEKFNKHNSEQINHLLSPFKEQLEGFRKQVKESYTHEQSERSALKHQLEQLQALNLKMSQDAINLTNALKGDNKQQGNWGEVILDRVLQESGLREGHEYDTQTDLKNEDGKRFKPDVIVHLPELKDVVIDSKMSLVAYETFFNSKDELEQKQAIQDHVISIRSHIKGLSQKNYQQLHGITSLDYVLMFIPIEPAFLLALEHDPELVNFALDHNVMLVSPTNLLVALRTIHNIWRYEYQNQHAQQIAQQAGKIYDKLCGFVTDMQKLGRALDTADNTYKAAMGKLSEGKGNLLRQAEQMKQLGVDTSKQLDNVLVDRAMNKGLDDQG